MTGRATEAEEFDSDWRSRLVRGQPPEVVLLLGGILEWFNHNEQERSNVERWFWECFEAELVRAAGKRLPTGEPRGLREFKVPRDVPFRGRTRLNYLVSELREMIRLVPVHRPEEIAKTHGLRDRGAASA